MVIMSLDVKLKDYDSMRREMEMRDAELAQSEEARRDLH